MPVDKFGRMSDTKTTDSGVSLTYINNNYVRSDGGTPLTGSLDMKGNIIYNVAEPVNPQDVATKVYVDNIKGSGVIGRKIGDAVSIKENMDFMGKQKIKNLPGPVNNHDAATKEYVDTKTELGDIDMEGKFTILNVKTPINDNHIADKKYVDDNTAFFVFRKNEYYAKGSINLRDGEASSKKYVDESLASHFIDINDNIVFDRNVDMKGKNIFNLPLPKKDDEPATKKYVHALQNQYLDKRGNIKYSRNINVDNKRMFALKDPKKDYEAAHKKYVDDSITIRIQEEKDKFLPKDPATKEYVDEAIKGLAGGDLLVSKEGVFIKANGHYRATAPLDIDNYKMENLPEPLEDGDAANKKYVDGVVEDLTLKQGLVRENGGFNLVDSYINMNFNNIRNVGLPNHEEDAVPRSFVDEEIKTAMKRVENQFKELNQLVSVCGSYYGGLNQNNYQFTFGGPIVNGGWDRLHRFNGFLVPANGVLKHFATFSTNIMVTIPGIPFGEIERKNYAPIAELYGKPDSSTKIFSLVKIEEKGLEEEEVCAIFFRLSNIRKYGTGIDSYIASTTEFKLIIAEKFRNKEENFICSVNRGDIINIRSEYTEPEIDYSSYTHTSIPIYNYRRLAEVDKINKGPYEHSLHTATLTFLFKEMSFPNVLGND